MTGASRFALASYGSRTQAEINEAAQILALGFCTVDSTIGRPPSPCRTNRRRVRPHRRRPTSRNALLWASVRSQIANGLEQANGPAPG